MPPPLPLLNEPMSGIDLAWLRMERATNPLVIIGVMMLGQHLTLAALRATLATRLLSFHRFRQVPAHQTLGTYWEDDPEFDLDAHVHRLALPARAGQAALEAAVSELASTPLDPSRALWHFHLIERYGRGSVLIGRFHHCYGDGTAMLRMVLSLTDPSPKARSHRAATAATPPSPLGPLDITALLGSSAKIAQELTIDAFNAAATVFHSLTHPRAAISMAQQAAAAGTELARIALLSEDPPTPLRAKLSTQKKIAWAQTLPLAEVKAVSKALGCTVNDVLLATAAGAFGTYLRERYAAIEGVTLRALVPVNLRGPELEPTLGNHFGLVFAALPIGERNPLARVYAVRQDMRSLKQSSQPLLAMWLLTALGMLPGTLASQVIEIFTKKASMVISNVPGPDKPLYLAGARIEQLHFWVPQAGSLGVGVSLLTYDGQVQFGVMADRNLIDQPSHVTQLFAREFEKLLLSTLMVTSIAAEARPTPYRSTRGSTRQSPHRSRAARRGR